MARTVAIGIQDYADIIKNNYFYVDKTHFIKEWWESGDRVTSIARLRRFGKTLNLNMLDYFFSNKHAGRGDLYIQHYYLQDSEVLTEADRSFFDSILSDDVDKLKAVPTKKGEFEP